MTLFRVEKNTLQVISATLQGVGEIPNAKKCLVSHAGFKQIYVGFFRKKCYLYIYWECIPSDVNKKFVNSLFFRWKLYLLESYQSTKTKWLLIANRIRYIHCEDGIYKENIIVTIATRLYSSFLLQSRDSCYLSNYTKWTRNGQSFQTVYVQPY